MGKRTGSRAACALAFALAGAAMLAGCGGGGSDPAADPQSIKTTDAHCAALQAGPHRVVGLGANDVTNPSAQYNLTLVETVDLSGPHPMVVSPLYGSAELVPVSGDTCHYKAGGGDVIVAASGVIAFTQPNLKVTGNPLQLLLAFPEQSRSVASLAGEWTALSTYARMTVTSAPVSAPSPVAPVSPSAGPSAARAQASAATSPDVPLVTYAGRAFTLSISNQGTAVYTDCLEEEMTTAAFGNTPCSDQNITLGQVTPPVDGGFLLTIDPAINKSGKTYRLFAYQSPAGAKLLVGMSAAGEFLFLTPKSSLPLPSVGTLTRSVDAILSATTGTPVVALLGNQYGVQTVDSTRGSFTRNAVQQDLVSGKGGVLPNQTVTLNAPLPGLAWRQESTEKVIGLPLRGMGLTFGVLPQNDGSTYLALSMERPTAP